MAQVTPQKQQQQQQQQQQRRRQPQRGQAQGREQQERREEQQRLEQFASTPYRGLQTLAKQKGIRANQSRESLLAELSHVLVSPVKRQQPAPGRGGLLRPPNAPTEDVVRQMGALAIGEGAGSTPVASTPVAMGQQQQQRQQGQASVTGASPSVRFSRGELSGMTYNNLRAAAKAVNTPAKGKTANLIEDILNAQMREEEAELDYEPDLVAIYSQQEQQLRGGGSHDEEGMGEGLGFRGGSPVAVEVAESVLAQLEGGDDEEETTSLSFTSMGDGGRSPPPPPPLMVGVGGMGMSGPGSGPLSPGGMGVFQPPPQHTQHMQQQQQQPPQQPQPQQQQAGMQMGTFTPLREAPQSFEGASASYLAKPAGVRYSPGGEVMSGLLSPVGFQSADVGRRGSGGMVGMRGGGGSGPVILSHSLSPSGPGSSSTNTSPVQGFGDFGEGASLSSSCGEDGGGGGGGARGGSGSLGGVRHVWHSPGSIVSTASCSAASSPLTDVNSSSSSIGVQEQQASGLLEDGEGGQSKHDVDKEALALEELVASRSYLAFTARKRVLCHLTGHEIPANFGDVVAYLRSKKVLRMLKDGPFDLKRYDPHLKEDPNDDAFVVCVLTGTRIYKNKCAVEKFLSSEQYKRALAGESSEKENAALAAAEAPSCTATRLRGVATPKGKRTVFSRSSGKKQQQQQQQKQPASPQQAQQPEGW